MDRARLLRRGVLLEGATVTWNIGEGIIAVSAGILASSVALPPVALRITVRQLRDPMPNP